MIAVIDASVGVLASLEPESGPWTRSIREASLVVAPSLFPAEVANAFWKYARSGIITQDQAETCLRSALALVDEYQPIQELAIESYRLAVLMKRPVYDLFYLVLARRTGSILLTADKSLADAARRAGVRINHDS
ncbi:MAG: type II toxin-antitoxin system VapC family toxin [Bryobacterales bacterium]|nr:type II toxin-antitoxin system VapC family toxin [Bryobacterales bacterium]